jgi:hypothetical protein
MNLNIVNESTEVKIAYNLKPKAPKITIAFSFGKENQKNFGGLGKIATEYLTSPAIIFDYERDFPQSSEIITKNRNRMNPKICQYIMSLNSWLLLLYYFYKENNYEKQI